MRNESNSGPCHRYPKGFRKKRIFNWVTLGITYASYYMCRYNFRSATPYLVQEFHFSKTDISTLWAAFSFAYGTGQLINGLFSDRIGGKNAMLIGGFGTIAINLVCGFSPLISTFSTFSIILLLNGYLQSWGAPGMVKINAAWFRRQERGTFSGIFGFMVQLGQMVTAQLAPLILTGFAIGTFVIAENQWQWLFRIPPLIAATALILIAFIVKESPEDAGFPEDTIVDEIDDEDGVRVPLRESFETIFKHPLVWYYALAYACTGAARHSSDQLAALFFVEKLHLQGNGSGLVMWALTLIPFVGVLGSLLSGWFSDKYLLGQRAPVAMALYFMAAVTFFCGGLLMNLKSIDAIIGVGLLVASSFPINATHSIVGAAAPMDIGGKKMAGFASGVIDSFQYYGSALAMPLIGWLLDKYGWIAWFPAMGVFCVVGGFTMKKLSLKKEKLIKMGIVVSG
ncbi:MFS transporter [Bdellovibrio sp. ZAP7]|uniref:MFS transporter n=1 Tax=Bdellovibrio sp. ZAP7 TaxID=2231053 RepID=UPI001165B65E|nr:MFS transporter [Bdellovibrio sp. ZAP7]QDK44959.1 MFS transporter [Bdellovibrio sp. ZAP7]